MSNFYLTQISSFIVLFNSIAVEILSKYFHIEIETGLNNEIHNLQEF